MPARTLLITGKVQGVFFRANVLENAKRLGLGGWVRNVADSSVEIHAEGPERGLDELEAWCRKGTEQSRVDDVVTAQTQSEGLGSFEIRETK